MRNRNTDDEVAFLVKNGYPDNRNKVVRSTSTKKIEIKTCSEQLFPELIWELCVEAVLIILNLCL